MFVFVFALCSVFVISFSYICLCLCLCTVFRIIVLLTFALRVCYMKEETSFTNSNLLGQLSGNIKLNLDLHKILLLYLSGAAYAKIFHRTAVLNKLICCRTYLRTCYLCAWVRLQSFIKTRPRGKSAKSDAVSKNYTFSLIAPNDMFEKLILCQQVCALWFNLISWYKMSCSNLKLEDCYHATHCLGAQEQSWF